MAPRPSSPKPPHASRGAVRLRFVRHVGGGGLGENETEKMKHRIIATDLRTDLVVITVVLGAVAVCVVIGFLFILVIAPF
jgi:hypothetical protein